MKTIEEKIKFQENKLVEFDKNTDVTAYLIGKIDISTKQHYLNEREEQRTTLALKINKVIDKIKD